MRGHNGGSERYGFGAEWCFLLRGTAYMTTTAVLTYRRRASQPAAAVCKAPRSLLRAKPEGRFQLEHCLWGGIG